MTIKHINLLFAVTATPANGSTPNEFARTMCPHPLIYQELPHNPRYSIYNRQLMSVELDSASPEEMYWMVRRKATLRHTAELPTEIRGADAEKLLNLIFTRDITLRFKYQVQPNSG